MNITHLTRKLQTKEPNLPSPHPILSFKLVVIFKIMHFKRVDSKVSFPESSFQSLKNYIFQPNNFIARKETYFHVVQWVFQLSSQFEVQSCGNASKSGSQGFSKDSQWECKHSFFFQTNLAWSSTTKSLKDLLLQNSLCIKVHKTRCS